MTNYYAVDVSAGIGPRELFRAWEEVKRAPEGSKVIFFDHEVRGVHNLPMHIAEARVRYMGGGGTLVKPVFDWLIANDPTADVFFLTDGYIGDRDVVKHKGRAACYVTVDMAAADTIHIANMKCFDHIQVLA